MLDIGGLGERGEVADPHVLDHAMAKRGHDQLLCEMNGATWRRRIVSQWSCQARGMALRLHLQQGHVKLREYADSNHRTTAKRFSRVPSMFDSLGVKVPYPT